MSLLSSMDDMLRNDAAMEVAEEMMSFNEDIVMEADDLIDAMVDGVDPLGSDPEIDRLEDEYEMCEEIDRELDEEDNEMAGVGAVGKDCKDTVVGQQNSDPNPEGNESGAKRDTNDPTTTKNGSIGQKNSSANPDGNVSKASVMKNDPSKTTNGSIGQKNSSPNPAKESLSFFELIMGKGEEIATESDTTEEVVDEEDEKTQPEKEAEAVTSEDELEKMNSSLDDDDDDLDD